MKIKFETIELEDLMEKLAAANLALVWKVCEEAGICPVCLMEMMYDMVQNAQDTGAVEHLNVDTMGEPPVKTQQ